MNEFLFSGWQPLLRVLVVGVLAYVALIVILRSTGKRTLSKLNAFDLVVTVALGSTVANVLLNKEVSLSEGIVGFLVLCGLQYVVTWSSVRWRWIRKIVKSEPRIVLLRGQPLESALIRERITVEELQAAARSEGSASLDDVQMIILETDGKLSVIPRSESD
jgi:uncharacterized membrane protein YcaP (DUF421 family)